MIALETTFLFTTLTSLVHEKCNLLKARVVIYAYQHSVGRGVLRFLARIKCRRTFFSTQNLM